MNPEILAEIAAAPSLEEAQFVAVRYGVDPSVISMAAATAKQGAVLVSNQTKLFAQAIEDTMANREAKPGLGIVPGPDTGPSLEGTGPETAYGGPGAKQTYAESHEETSIYIPADDLLFVVGPDGLYREADSNGIPMAGGSFYDAQSDQVIDSYYQARGAPAPVREPGVTVEGGAATTTAPVQYQDAEGNIVPEGTPGATAVVTPGSEVVGPDGTVVSTEGGTSSTLQPPPGEEIPFIGGFGPQYQVPNPRRTAFEKAAQWGGINTEHYESAFGTAYVPETVSPLYLEGDQWGMFSGKSVEEIAQAQLMLIDAGLVKPSDLEGIGHWGLVEANAMTALMTEANGHGITWLEAADRRVEAISKLPEPTDEDVVDPVTGAGGFNATLPIPPVETFNVPDYATLKQQARSLFRDALGRDPQGYELALFADSLLADYQAEAEAQLGQSRKDYQRSIRLGQRQARQVEAAAETEAEQEEDIEAQIRGEVEDVAEGQTPSNFGPGPKMGGDIWLRNAEGRLVRTDTDTQGGGANHVVKAPKYRGRIESDVDPLARTIERFLASYQGEIDQNERSAALNANFTSLVNGLGSLEADVEG